MVKSSGREYFVSLQILRGLAALFVVLLHVSGEMHVVIPQLPWDWSRRGAAGVDTFFTLSGFVIAITIGRFRKSPTGWQEFAWHRIARIVPLYWALTAVKVLLAAIYPTVMRGYAIVWAHVLASFLLVPFALGNDHTVFPVLVVGWTLFYEALFYAVAALSLRLGLPLVRLTAVFFVPLAIVGLFHPRLPDWLAFYAQPFVLEFIAGIMIARLSRKGWILPPWAAVSAIVLGALFLCFVASVDETQYSRIVFYGIPGALFTAGFVGLERFLRRPFFKPLAVLGDASYGIYLTHTQVLAVLLLGFKFGLFASFEPFVLMGGFVLIACAIGIPTFYFFERPAKRALLNWGRTFLGAPVAAGSATGS